MSARHLEVRSSHALSVQAARLSHRDGQGTWRECAWHADLPFAQQRFGIFPNRHFSPQVGEALEGKEDDTAVRLSAAFNAVGELMWLCELAAHLPEFFQFCQATRLARARSSAERTSSTRRG